MYSLLTVIITEKKKKQGTAAVIALFKGNKWLSFIIPAGNFLSKVHS